MGNAEIDFTQGASTGGPGFALIGVAGSLVTVSNGDDSNIENWKFEVLDVGYDSEVSQGVVQDGDTPTWTFTPDVAGGYMLRLTTTDESGNVYVDERVFGVLEENGLFIPPFMADAGSMNFAISMGVYNTKGWSPYLRAWLRLVEAGGGAGTPYELDCTAGGTVTYSGPTSPYPSAVRLTGTPGSPYSVEFPASSAWSILFQNLSGQLAAIDIGGSGGVAQIPSGPGYVPVYSDGSYVTGTNPNFLYSGDVVPLNFSGFTGLGVATLGQVNDNNPGQSSFISIYGSYLNPLDASTWGVTPPSPFQGTPNVVQGTALWWTDQQGGWYSVDATGVTTQLVSGAGYPTVGHNSQALTVGGFVQAGIGAGPIGATSIVGSGNFQDFYYTPPSSGIGASTTRVTALAQVRVIASTGSTEQVGDCATIEQDYDVVYVSGSVVAVIAVGAPRSSSYNGASYPTPGTLAGVTLAAVTDGGEVDFTISTPVGFDSSTVVDAVLFCDRSRTT